VNPTAPSDAGCASGSGATPLVAADSTDEPGFQAFCERYVRVGCGSKFLFESRDKVLAKMAEEFNALSEEAKEAWGCFAEEQAAHDEQAELRAYVDVEGALAHESAESNWGLVSEPLPEHFTENMSFGQEYYAPIQMQNGNISVSRCKLVDVATVARVTLQCRIGSRMYVLVDLPLQKGNAEYVYPRCPIKSCVPDIQVGVPYQLAKQNGALRFVGREAMVTHIKYMHGPQCRRQPVNNTYCYTSHLIKTEKAFKQRITQLNGTGKAPKRKHGAESKARKVTRAGLEDTEDDDDDDFES
jgi:hypothetical protein